MSYTSKNLHYMLRSHQLGKSGTMFLALLCLSITLTSCKKKHVVKPINPAFSSYISAFTSGIISRESNIRIRLASDYKDSVNLTTPIKDKLFSFDPSLKGKAYWVDRRTIEFRPDENMPSGRFYDASFKLSKVLKVPDSLATFDFNFQIIKQSFEVIPGAIKTYDAYGMKWYYLEGRVLCADVANGVDIEKIASATQDGKSLKINWKHTDDRRVHEFTVDSILRSEARGQVILHWDGKQMNVDEKGDTVIAIPSLSDFSVMNFNIVQQPEQYVSLQFSDPIKEGQNLDGLIHFSTSLKCRFIIDANEVRVYPPYHLTGSQSLVVEPGIRNALDYKLEKGQTLQLGFEDIKPAVQLDGKGVILPNSNGLLFPFQAVNLRSVQVRITRIFENNVQQFLQVNQLDGQSEMHRVGRVVLKKEVRLQSTKPVDFGKWNTFYLDISDLIKAEPGAIYNVEIGFKRKDSMYPCAGSDSTADDQEMQDVQDNFDDDQTNDRSYWDYAENYYSDNEDGEGYNWSDRDNPCTNSYYNRDRYVNRNIFASDLGIIAKSGSNNSFLFAVSNMITTEPMSGVTVELYNYQNQLITTGTTDGNGLLTVPCKAKPYLAIAKNGKQRGYLRLDDGSSLSLSKFDVAGEVIQKGLKGFIYGERGVWRPGDTLFLAFMLQDVNKVLPANHPVIFELTNPQGQMVNRTVATTSVNDFYNFTCATNENAPTGNWTATVKVGGSTFTKSLKIETIKPNRLKIKLDFGTDKLSVLHPDIQGDLSVSWLTGANARNMAAKVMVTLKQSHTDFPRYKDYTFDDPTRKFESDEQTLLDGKIDGNGKAKISSKIDVKSSAPGMLEANFVTRVFEEGGDFSIDRYSIPYSPFTSYVGVMLPKGDRARGMLLTDTSHVIDVVTVDADGKPVARQNLEGTLYKISWKWWWDASDNDLSNYVGTDYEGKISTTTFSTDKTGHGTFKIRVNYPDWGRYMVRVCDPASGHCTGKIVYIDWPGWAGRGQRENPGGASMLTFSSDKTKYNVGEEAKITFPSSGIGRALVSIESGSKVLKAYWVKAEKDQTTFKFPITGDMAPNVYVNVTLVQPHAQTANDLPIRMYGVIPLMVENPASRLQPVIKMPEVLRPEEKASITVSEAKGKRMTYTLAVVDEGLLDLTRYKTPDPWSNFYAREALGVKTWDMYDLVMGAFVGKMEQILSIGGDEDLRPGEKNKAKRFKPVVKYFGPFELKPGEKKTTTFMMPNYIGAVRTMVVAGDIGSGAFGNAQQSTPVRKPLMVLATLPRVLGPGEKVKLPVTLFAMEKQVKNVEVQVVANGMFKPLAESKKTITFKDLGDQVVNFDLEVVKGIGVGTVKIVATSGKERSEYDVQLQVRNPNPPVTTTIDAVVDAGKSWDADYAPPGMAGTNTAILEVSSLQPIDFGRRLQYLLHYPYGCVEQTTSSGFPQLFLADVMQLDDKAKQRASDNVKATINRLRLFQVSDGGLSYWPDGGTSNQWGTSYAGHFLIEAENKGYTLPAGLKDNWKNYQTRMAREWSRSQYDANGNPNGWADLDQAYRLYTLALAKAPELGAMNRLKELPNLSLQARWRLAAAYVLAGQTEVANKLIANQSTDIKPYNELAYSYGSALRDKAMILETLTLLRKRTEGAVLAKEISSTVQSQEWLSTQETAYCLLAISKFMGSSGASSQLKYLATINGKNNNVFSQQPISQLPIAINGANGGKIHLTNQGSGSLYVRITMTGTPETGDQKSGDNGLNMSIAYKDLKGNVLNVDKLEQGTDFMAEVTINNPSPVYDYPNLALSQIFPSGWEISNTRLDGGSVHTKDIPTYQDIRDDRVYSFFNLPHAQTKTFVVLLNASYLGDFYLPTVYCEAMYRKQINSSKAGRWVKVVKPGELVGAK